MGTVTLWPWKLEEKVYDLLILSQNLTVMPLTLKGNSTRTQFGLLEEEWRLPGFENGCFWKCTVKGIHLLKLQWLSQQFICIPTGRGLTWPCWCWWAWVPDFTLLWLGNNDSCREDPTPRQQVCPDQKTIWLDDRRTVQQPADAGHTLRVVPGDVWQNASRWPWDTVEDPVWEWPARTPASAWQDGRALQCTAEVAGDQGCAKWQTVAAGYAIYPKRTGQEVSAVWWVV